MQEQNQYWIFLYISDQNAGLHFQIPLQIPVFSQRVSSREYSLLSVYKRRIISPVPLFCLLPEDGPEEFTAKFEAAIEGLDDFLVFADLLGGTPCNVVSRLIMEGRDIDLYAGMNLPMVIEFINASLTGADADYKNRAAESIVKVNDLLAGFDDDEDE